MNLSEGIRRYVEQKRRSGFFYLKGESNFVAFCKQAGDIPLSDITTLDLINYLDGAVGSSNTWQGKYLTLCRFFEYWSARGVMPALEMPPQRLRVRSTYTPHVYSRTELFSILAAITTSQEASRCDIDSKTLRMLILMLYGTGATLGELLHLERQDVDMRKRSVRVQNQYIKGFRDIPIGHDLRCLLREFRTWRFCSPRRDQRLFVRKSGKHLTRDLVSHNFSRLIKIEKIRRNDGLSGRPRLQDLRPTFAVHRISSWLADGVDLNIMLPALAAYMGQSGLGSTERYLSLTPERFHKQLDSLSPKRKRKHWRDDAGLLKFLATMQG